MRKLGPQAELPILCLCLTPVVILKGGDCLSGFSLLSAGCYIGRNVDAFYCPGSCFVTASSFGHLPQNHLGNPGTSFHGHLKEQMFPSIALGIRRRKSTCFFCQSKFSPSLISSIKSPVKSSELQSITKSRMWLYLNMLTTELWNDLQSLSNSQLDSDFLPTLLNSRVRETGIKGNFILPQMQSRKIPQASSSWSNYRCDCTSILCSETAWGWLWKEVQEIGQAFFWPPDSWNQLVGFKHSRVKE